MSNGFFFHLQMIAEAFLDRLSIGDRDRPLDLRTLNNTHDHLSSSSQLLLLSSKHKWPFWKMHLKKIDEGQ